MADNSMQSSGMNTGNFGSGAQDDANRSAGGMAQGAMDKMGDMASRAGEKIMDMADQQKSAGADFASDMAGAVRRAAGQFDDQLPQAGEYIRYAADQLDYMSDAFRRRDMRQLVDDVQSFARRQPTAFLGITFLAGFAAVRFLKSSSPQGGSRQGGYGSQGASQDQQRSWREDRFSDDGRYGQADMSRGGQPNRMM